MRFISRLILAAALAVAAAPSARAEGFSTTNFQLLQGYNFHDPLYDTQSGTMTTLTLNTFSTWEYGDSFFFADLYSGNFKPGAQGNPAPHKDGASLYAEWHPRLFINQLLGQKEPLAGIVRNWGLAAEVNQGVQYYAYLGGLGLDFAVPAGYVLGLNLYYRYDRFAYHQYQVSPYWTVPFALGRVPFLFTGFVDINGTRSGVGDRQERVEIWAQPELLVDVLAPFGGKANRLWLGTEVWYHRGFQFPSGQVVNTWSPQIMVQWTVI